MYAAFGGKGGEFKTEWYDFIDRISIGGFGGDTVTVDTTLYDDSDAKEPASSICLGVVTGTLDLEAGISKVKVLAVSGDTLKDCGPPS